MAFSDFLGFSPDSAYGRRARAGHGVYGVKLYDFARSRGDIEVDDYEAGIDPDAVRDGTASFQNASFSNHSVAIFVLDGRTHKTPWKKGPLAYLPDPEGDFLGERQWKWFETAIRRSKAAVNVVVNGLQVHANRFPDGNIAEAWGKYPVAQQRLFDAILQDGVESPILISGDVHMTQLLRKDCVRNGAFDSQPRPLFEFTTSGMTHTWGTPTNPPLSKLTSQPTWRDLYRAMVSRTFMRLMHHICPWTDIVVSDPWTDIVRHGRYHRASPKDLNSGGGEGSKRGIQYSLSKNFGELEFDWDERTVSIRSIGENVDDPPLLMMKVSMDQLSGKVPTPGSKVHTRDFSAEAKMRARFQSEMDWVCVNHRGRENIVSHLLGHFLTGLTMAFLIPVPLLLPSVVFLLMVRRTSSRREKAVHVNNC